jgi:ATP-binding cassette subfamily B protein
MSEKQIQQEAEYKEIDFKLLKRLLVFLKPFRNYVFLSILLTLGTSALGPLRPYLTHIAIDNYISPGNWDGLVWIVALIVGLMMIHGALQFGLTYLMQWVGQRVLYNIRVKLFNHIQSRKVKFFDNNPVGRLVTRVTNDVEVLNDLFSSGVVMIIADLLLIIWIIIFMLYTDWRLTLLTLSFLPVLIFITSIFRRKVRAVFRDIRLNVASMNSFLNEFISGILTIKIFTNEQKLNNEFEVINQKNKNLWIKTINYYSLFFPFVEFMSSVALCIVLWYTANNILSSQMTVGILIAFIQYAEMFFRPIRDLTEKYTTLQSAMASSERIFSLLDNQDSLDDSSEAKIFEGLKKKIEFKNVSFSYDDTKYVLKNISFDINRGETVAIVGATGAGKTSLINLLCRFYEFQSGDILIDGVSIRNIDQKSLRSKIALVMQDVFLFSRDIAENISLGKEEITLHKIEESAGAIGAKDFIEALPEKYSTEVMERGVTLSAGQRQLIAFSRAFAADPDILILDEATSNIDTNTEKIIEESLSKLLHNRTSIVIAHRLSTIKRADKIILFHHGEIREIGTHHELLEMNGIYAKLYQLQFKEQNGIIAA